MGEEKKLFRSNDTLTIRNVRVMKVDQPREVNDELTLCSFSVVLQPGNEKDLDQWVRVTAKNGLAERVFAMQPGDRVNVAGKPFFGSYTDKDGNVRTTVEIKFPEYIDFLTPKTEKAEGTVAEVEEEEETKPEPVKTEKRKPGRPAKAKTTARTNDDDDIPFED